MRRGCRCLPLTSSSAVWLALRAGTLAALMAVLTSDGGAMATNQQPARDDADVARRLLRGQVRSDDDSAALLRRVRVTLVGSTLPPVFTDQEGRFEILVPDRPFELRVTKPGFAPELVRQADTVDSTRIDVRLARGSAINGHLIDNAGTPVVDARVAVRRVADGGARRQVPINVFVRTDDLGEFRVGSLPAGRYDIAVDTGGGREAVVPGSQGTRLIAALQSGEGEPAAAARELPATAVMVRTAEETSVTVIHDRRMTDYRAAASYVASVETDNAQAALKIALQGLRGTTRGAALARGTAVIAGRVTDHTGRPVAGAIVRLDPVTPAAPRAAASDTTGRYQFNAVVVGAYRVSAAKTGFIEAEYGQERAAQPGTVLTVRDRQRVDRIDIGLRRGAAITGSVTDPDGEPIEGLAMHAWRLQYRSGLPVTESAGVVRRTDDRGRYRLHGLPAGTYYVVAADEPTASESMAAVMRAPRVFYPGAPAVAQAAPVYVDVGLDAAGVDVAFVAPPTVRVSGRATDAGGNPLKWPVVLVGSTRSGFPAPAPQMAVMKGWDFEFPHVTPGEYVIQATQQWSDMPEPRPPSEFVVQPLSVGEQDVTGVSVHTTAGTTVSGRIVMENRTRPWFGGEWLTVASSDPDYEPAAVLPRPWVTLMAPDLSFRITGLWGPLRITSRATLPPSAWLKNADMGGVNLADESALFGRRDGKNTYVEVQLADDGAIVSGRVVNGRKEPVGQYVVAVFPVAVEQRYSGSRYIRLARPGENGQFQAGMLPPGDYFVAAVDALDDAGLQDPETVRRLTEAGRRVTLASGERLTTDLPLLRLAR